MKLIAKPCPYGCLMHPSGRLMGDCRAPSQKNCELNRRIRKRNKKKQSKKS